MVKQGEKEEEEPTATYEPEAASSEGNKILVVYFSRTGENYSVGTVNKGNTSYLADYIIEYTGADKIERLLK